MQIRWILAFRRLKKQAQTTCRQAYNKYINDIICSEPGASRRLGAFIKANRCDQTGVAPLKEGNLLHSDPKAKADVLNRQFASVFTSDNTSDSPDLGPSPYPPMNDIIINNQGIFKLLKNLSPHKDTGPDGILARKLLQKLHQPLPSCTRLHSTKVLYRQHGREHWLSPFSRRATNHHQPTTGLSL